MLRQNLLTTLKWLSNAYVHPSGRMSVSYGTGTNCFIITMTILARFILNQKAKANRYRIDCLRYRGVAYKK